MDKLKSLEIKMLIDELKYLESSVDYKNELLEIADVEFLKVVNEHLDNNDNLKEMFNSKVDSMIEESINIPTQSTKKDIIPTTEKDSKLKKLYREIVKATHPDKTVDKELNDIYVKATEMYENNNKIGIYKLCSDVNIKFDYLEEDIDLINSEISKKSEKIKFIESTISWQWYNAINDVVRDNILLSYFKNAI